MSLESTGIGAHYIERMSSTIRNNKVMHAYIFESDSCIDKQLLAKEFAKSVLCEKHTGSACDECNSCLRIDHDNHEDIVYVQTNDKGNIVDDAVEDLIIKLKRKPLVGEKTIAIVPNADSMTQRAQNRLLKTLEEPTGDSVVILLSDNTENILQTIRSRCVIYRINDYSKVPESEAIDMAAKLTDMMIKGEPFYRITRLIEPVQSDRQNTIALLEAMEYVYKELYLSKSPEARLYKRQYIQDAIEIIEAAKRDLTSIKGLKCEYTLKDVLLRIGG